MQNRMNTGSSGAMGNGRIVLVPARGVGAQRLQHTTMNRTTSPQQQQPIHGVPSRAVIRVDERGKQFVHFPNTAQQFTRTPHYQSIPPRMAPRRSSTTLFDMETSEAEERALLQEAILREEEKMRLEEEELMNVDARASEGSRMDGRELSTTQKLPMARENFANRIPQHSVKPPWNMNISVHKIASSPYPSPTLIKQGDSTDTKDCKLVSYQLSSWTN